MHHKTTILVAPALQNISCTHPRYSQASFLSMLGPGDVLQAFIVLMLTVGVLAANVLLILVINSRRYSKYIHSQVGALRRVYYDKIRLLKPSVFLASLGKKNPFVI